MKTQLRKISWNKGTTDTGVEYDYTRIQVEIPVYEKQEREFGVDILELEYGSEADHKELLHLRGKLPCMVEVEWIPAKKGKNNVNVVTKLELVNTGHQKPQNEQKAS